MADLLENYRITQNYGVRGDYRKGYHTGLDIVSDNPSIYSPVAGTVIESRYAPGKGADPSGWGNYVIIRTQDGFDTLFAHLQSINVNKGASVASGTVLGQVGNTGNSTGPHLHFEVWQGDWNKRNDINPLTFLQGLSSATSGFKFPELKSPVDMSQAELLKMAGIGALVIGVLALAKE